MSAFISARQPTAGFLTLAFGSALAAAPLSEAAVILDWLAFQPLPDRSEFYLFDDDDSTAAVIGRVEITAGAFVPATPSSGVLQSPFWGLPPLFEDSTQHDGSVLTTRVQVAPQAGSVQWQLSLLGSNLNGMTFAVGQLFYSGGAGTSGVGISALTPDGLTVPVEFLGTNTWDDGIRLYTAPLEWDAGQHTLRPGIGAAGNTGFGFFRIPAGNDPVTRLLFDVPDGYAAGAGDALEFAFAMPVPEPGSTALLLLSAVWLSHRKRHRTDPAVRRQSSCVGKAGQARERRCPERLIVLPEATLPLGEQVRLSPVVESRSRRRRSQGPTSFRGHTRSHLPALPDCYNQINQINRIIYMKQFAFIAALFMSLPCIAAHAGAVPWMGNISTSTTITVPAGKILVIEQIGTNWFTPLSIGFTITGPGSGGIGGSFTSTFTLQLSYLTKLASPVRLGPGMTISGGAGGVALLGTVIDASDFIASADPTVRNLTEGGQLAALVDSRTSEQTRTTGEASNDLVAWSSTGVSVSRSSSNPRISKIVTPKDVPKKFVRAKVTRSGSSETGD